MHYNIVKSCMIVIVIKRVNFQQIVQVDNRVSSHGTSAPLLPILHRFGAVPPLKAPSSSPPLWDDNMPLEVCVILKLPVLFLACE